MEAHFANIGLVRVSPTGSIYNSSNSNRTIKDSLSFETQHRILPDSTIPNTLGYPTIQEYLDREAVSGFMVVQVGQSFIVTREGTSSPNITPNSGAQTYSFPNIINGPEVDLLVAGTTIINIPADTHGWVSEVGLTVSKFDLDGGALTVQPTISFGIIGDNDKHLLAQPTTLLNAPYTRERFVTLLTDVGETSFTMEITVPGTIAGGGGAELYRALPYWVVRLIAD